MTSLPLKTTTAQGVSPRAPAVVKPSRPAAYPRGGSGREGAPRWHWQDRADGRGTDLALWFGPDGERGPEKAAREARAIAVCGSCPVRLPCLAAAFEYREQHGTQGGMTEDERASERRRRMRSRLRAGRKGEAA